MNNEKIYVILTDKGYLKTDGGIQFVAKKKARRFTRMEILAYKSSIIADLVEFHSVKEIIAEAV